ncbi:hypothetical protein KO507_11795 [Gilvimarinus agarilyticus]|uniref:sulfotransferase family 2 domain-containing protein n=1 Tax=Gilvimarinus sp. 2_MG-2023 TaxID=3062666 RepID=UPI001C081555|nr:sulfotransferase family 2 domain-containing protein [Gilvimarinus sp. 2_MG-2023]MBU2886447.1 hypothetical protein [Gilvimarinus agarilyticus]MDO6571126.1 sulfotransferase family 2 domain-containing protein [Gilvimarinus sp. 2_MG-2023]
MRPVILHYHLFKNAGTSIDSCLEKSFGKNWLNYDSPVGHTICANQIVELLEQHPELRALSSHDTAPPLPSGDFRVLPIVFLRHPLLRAKSAYLFEESKQKGLEASTQGFRDYVAKHINDLNGGVITNFQACRLANQSPDGPDAVTPTSEDEYAARSCAFIDSLAFFGLVEQFYESFVRLKYYLIDQFPDIQIQYTWKNSTTHTEASTGERLETIAKELGPELYQQLCQRNRQDLKLYQHAAERFNAPLS